MTGVQYDVFLSYRTKGPAGFWVREFFARELQDWLGEQASDRPSLMFYDRDSIGVGEEINDKLIAALAATTIFVPVLSPSYFNQSPWCRWEWSCFRAWRPDAIMPVLFYNRTALPPEVQLIKMADFTSANSSFAAWRNTESYGGFQVLVREFAQAIANKAASLPPPASTKFPADVPMPDVPGIPEIRQRQMVAAAAGA